MFKGFIIDYNRDIFFKEIIISYNQFYLIIFLTKTLKINYNRLSSIIISYLAKLCQFKTKFELYLMCYFFVSIRKSLKERSLDHFGLSEPKVLPRNKRFIEILSN